MHYADESSKCCKCRKACLHLSYSTVHRGRLSHSRYEWEVGPRDTLYCIACGEREERGKNESCWSVGRMVDNLLFFLVRGPIVCF